MYNYQWMTLMPRLRYEISTVHCEKRLYFVQHTFFLAADYKGMDFLKSIFYFSC